MFLLQGKKKKIMTDIGESLAHLSLELSSEILSICN
jgi:hypothetical protein